MGLRYGGDARTRDDGALDDDGYGGGPELPDAEVFVDLGIAANQLHSDVEPNLPQYGELGR